MHFAVTKSSRTNTAQLGRALHTRAHTYTHNQCSQSLWDSRCWAASLRLIKTTVCVCVHNMYIKCVHGLTLYSAPSLYHLSWLEGAGLFNRYFINAVTVPHHHGNSRTLLIEAKLCFHSWRSSLAPPPPIPDPEARLQRWQNTPLPDFPLDVNSSWSPCDQHITHTHMHRQAHTNTHTATRLHPFISPQIKTLYL